MSNRSDKPLKVILLSHSDTLGGAAVVTYRLMQALRDVGVDARMIVFMKNGNDPCVATACERNLRNLHFIPERLRIMASNGFNRRDLFKVSIASCGVSLHRHPWVQEADIIAINWINQGLLSLSGIRALSKLGKPIVWTMHDMWCMTGICHHAYECQGFQSWCGYCPFIKSGRHENDLSRKIWLKKQRLYRDAGIHFVAVSNWVADKARESGLLKEQSVSVIPNALPVDFFITKPTAPVKQYNIDYSRKLILMGAARLDDPIKGLEYAIEAFNYIFDNHPELANQCSVVLFGDLRDETLLKKIRMHYHHLGRINDNKLLRQLYAASSVVVSTSLYETFGCTLIEGQASGCVPVSFGMGGQSDIIDHKVNGYIADYKSSKSIAEGIIWALNNTIEREALHQSVKERFSSEVVATEYIRLFHRLLKR